MSQKTNEPLGTSYIGREFRSRLRLRWAVFFYWMKFQWEYDPENGQLDGDKYIPDFWLPQPRMYAAVRSRPFTRKEFDALARHVQETGHDCLLLDSPPDYRYYPFISVTRDLSYAKYLRGESVCYWLTSFYINRTDRSPFYTEFGVEDIFGVSRDDITYISAVEAARLGVPELEREPRPFKRRRGFEQRVNPFHH